MVASCLFETMSGKTFEVAVSPLEAAQLIASRFGFFDLDLEVDDRGVKIVASANQRQVTARGKTLDEACDKLVEAIYG